MDQTQQTEQTTDESTQVEQASSPVDPQLADVGTTGEHTLGIAPEADPALRTDHGSAAAPLTDADAAALLHGDKVIEPSIGRKMHFYPNGASFHSTPYVIDASRPMDADVVYVWSERMVNLSVRDHIGQVHAFTSITLRQPEDAIPQGPYAEWMPFQVAQARGAA